jgi:glucose/arabinose dehydrogenase
VSPLSRRRLLRVGAACSLPLAGCASPGDGGDATPTDGTQTTDGTAGETPTDTGGDTATLDVPARVGVAQVAGGFVAPVSVEFPPGVSDAAYVADQVGRVHRVADGTVADAPFLDVTDRLVDLNAGYDERGLLGLAFHPDFAENRRVFVRYSAPPREGTPAGHDHTFVLAEFEATADGRGVVPDSERTVLEVPQPQSNHNAGDLAFGPDGHLYVGVGDGGGADDEGTGHVADWYDAVPGGNGQDVTANLLGSVLRLDVDAGDPYAVPDDNPLVGREGLDEQYAWGFRNPWRISVDGDTLLAADVGQRRWEEVNRVVAGGNYGWNVREGRHCFRADDCPTETPDGERLRDPVVEYPHGSSSGPSGVAVVGGHVYRGDAVPALAGRYVFADWDAGGTLFVADPREAKPWPLATTEMAPGTDSAPGDRVLGFGRDATGEVYVCTSANTGLRGTSGAVHRLAPAP